MVADDLGDSILQLQQIAVFESGLVFALGVGLFFMALLLHLHLPGFVPVVDSQDLGGGGEAVEREEVVLFVLFGLALELEVAGLRQALGEFMHFPALCSFFQYPRQYFIHYQKQNICFPQLRRKKLKEIPKYSPNFLPWEGCYDLRKNIIQMPKVVDNYVFERKIGSGQYGDVYKGYNKNNGMDIAIKAIKRESIKGKFMELLENQIKVLKTCDNRNIIKLYDIKKTANNFYLILEYCNEGDLMVYLKKKKTLSEEEAVEFFVQILHAFKTLVKHKIMHRDFKLPNILMHDGEIKIADFGFSKLLSNEQFAQTMLGSPLNMAPEVLGGTQYNSKADIWSVGTCFYELLFGTPPYKAKNMVDLVNNIKNKPLSFPKEINRISEVTEDVIRKMLIVDPKKRIEWEDLFKHPITTLLEEKIKEDMESTMKENEDIELNMSKFYMKNNMVVDHPKEITQKENINNYAYDVMNKKGNQPFEGQLIKRELKRKEAEKMSEKDFQETEYTEKPSMKEIIGSEETEKEKQMKAFKRNSNKLLHHRNIYVLLASVGEETMNQAIKFSDIAGYMLIRKLLSLLEWLKENMENKHHFEGMEYWQLYVKTKDYQDIRNYIDKEYSVFHIFSNSIHNKIKPSIQSLDPETQSVYNNPKSPLTEKVYQRILREYLRCLYGSMKEKKFSFEADEKKMYIHISRIIDCLSIAEIFQYQRDGVAFNFRNYYSEPQRMSVEELRREVEKKQSII